MFLRFCRWLGQYHILALLLSAHTLGISLSLAGFGRSIHADMEPNLISCWSESNYGKKLRWCALALAVINPILAVINCIDDSTNINARIIFGLLLLLPIPGLIELFFAMKKGQDSFVVLPVLISLRESGDPGPVGSFLLARLSNKPMWLRYIGGAAWTWMLGIAMLYTALLLICLYAAIYFIAFALAHASNSQGNRRSETVDEIPPVLAPGEKAKRGHGIPFSDVVATREGDQIKEGYGGPLAKVIATIESDQIKEGYGGPLARVLATIEGDQIKEGYGGPLSTVLATIDGNQIKSGYGGIFADVQYTVERVSSTDQR